MKKSAKRKAKTLASSSSSSPSPSPVKSPNSKFKYSKHYVIKSNKINGKMTIREIFAILNKNELINGSVVKQNSHMEILTEPEILVIAKKLGWAYKKQKLDYIIRVKENLSFMNGSALRNISIKKNITEAIFKKMIK